MLTRRGFLQTTGTASRGACRCSATTGWRGSRQRGGASEGIAANDLAARRELLARDPAGVHARPHDHQPEQRRLLPEPARRARGVQALPRHLEPVARVPHVADPRAEHRERAAPARRGVRLRSRGDGDHAQRQRGAADRAARHRPQAGRRGRHHQPGLRADARHLGTARAPRRDQADEDLVPGAAEVDGRARRAAARRDHAGDEGAALLPHHQPHRADLPGEEDRRRGAAPRHQDDRRRRARVRALPVHGCRSRLRLLRHQPAQVAARADRHRLPLRAARRTSRRSGRSRRRPRRAPTTSASSRRSARTRRRTTTPSPKR